MPPSAWFGCTQVLWRNLNSTTRNAFLRMSTFRKQTTQIPVCVTAVASWTTHHMASNLVGKVFCPEVRCLLIPWQEWVRRQTARDTATVLRVVITMRQEEEWGRSGRRMWFWLNTQSHTYTNACSHVWLCASHPINTAHRQALTIEHTCRSLLHKHPTPCRRNRIAARIPSGGGRGGRGGLHGCCWPTVAGGERHFPDRWTHI